MGARAALNAAVKAFPDNYWLALRYAYLSYLLKDFKAAAAHYEKAAVLGPKEITPLEGLLYVSLGTGNGNWKNRALALLSIDPGHREANLRLGYEESSKGRCSSAVKYYSTVAAATPNDADALLGRGWALLYCGYPWKAGEDFKSVLALFPENASAKQGLAWTSKKFNVGTGFSYAGLDYHGVATKTGGYSNAFPLTLGYKNFSLTGQYIYTRINFVPPIADAVQKEFNLSGTLKIMPKLSLQGAFDHISVNDPATNNGKIYAIGGNYSTALREGDPAYAVVGGYYTYSRYPHFNSTQYVPHLSLGSGWVYADFSTTYINLGSTNERLSSYSGTFSLGPWRGWSITVKDYIGYKRDAVEEWGTLVSNNADLYRGGWKAILSWTRDQLTVFGVWGNDKVRATVVGLPVDYTSKTAVGGLSWKFDF